MQTHHCARAQSHGAATTQTERGHTVRKRPESNRVTLSIVGANHATPQQHAEFTPACLARTHTNALSTVAAQNRATQRHHRQDLATQCAAD